MNAFAIPADKDQMKVMKAMKTCAVKLKSVGFRCVSQQTNGSGVHRRPPSAMMAPTKGWTGTPPGRNSGDDRV
jgi:hypothetical protein